MTLTERIASQLLVTRRLIALVIVIAAGAFLWWLIVQPVIWLATSQGKWRTHIRTELAHSRGEASVLDQVRASLTRLPADPVWDRLYLADNGTSPAALLQRDITRLCAQSGIDVQSAATNPSEANGALAKYTVRVVMSTTADHLRMFFEQVRRSQHYLRVERLRVSAPQQQPRDENPTLSITVDIAGYARDLNKGERGAHT